MYRSHTCGELRIENVNEIVKLCGWVQRIRLMGGMTFVDLRDRYGITQLVFNIAKNKDLCEMTQFLGREFVIQVEGKVIERSSKNPDLPTGDIEMDVETLNILNPSEVPPFTIKDETDGGEELRMKYRYLDLRRTPLQKALELRHKMSQETRKYLNEKHFLDIETPFLIRSTPEGARDFVVPSRAGEGKFYALPQSPQLFKQLLMVAGYDKYYQIVRCFRDEDLRADRQPEFTQIDCEMSFVEQEDILQTFEGLAKHLFKTVRNIEFEKPFLRMSYAEAMEFYGSDKPDLRFDMRFTNITDLVKGKNFKVFDESEYIGAICVKNISEYSRKQIDELTEWVKRPQIGAKGLVYVKFSPNTSGIKSSVDKFYSADELKIWAEKCNAQEQDTLLILCGEKEKTLVALGELRLEMAKRLGLRDSKTFFPLWVLDFPLLEWDAENQRFQAKHHPFTSPHKEDFSLLDSNPAEVRANAYDLVINGTEIGGGSIRIHNSELQKKMFNVLGFSQEEAEKQFGFLLNAFKFGAPPHGGIAFGFDRWTAIFNESESIRDVMAFPKNNAGRDMMLDTPAPISQQQINELHIRCV